jgi:diacylglycerol kinase (ATP)
MRPQRRRFTMLKSFNHAFQGLVYAVRYERNMRIHIAVALLVLIVSLFLNVSRLELVVVVVAIAFVLAAEMVNSAIEAVVDIITDEFDPRAKVAKDVAAGAVLVAAINALVVAYLVFADKLARHSLELLVVLRRSPTHLTFVALAVVILAVIVLKAVTHRRPLAISGGLPSGHSAVAFAGWTAVTFVVGGTPQGVLVSVITLMMAALVAQTRVEAGIHSVLEVVLGGMLGMLVTTLVFQFWF